MDKSLTSKTVAATTTAVSDSEDEMNSELEFPAVVSNQGDLSDRDPPNDEELDQEISEEANYRETMRGEGCVLLWAGTRSQTLIAHHLQWTTTLLPVPEPSLQVKYPSSYQQMTGCTDTLRN